MKRHWKETMRKIFSVTALLAAILTVCPMGALAADTTTITGISGGKVSYTEGQAVSIPASGREEGVVRIEKSGSYTLSGDFTKERIEIAKSTAGDVTLLLNGAKLGNEDIDKVLTAAHAGELAIVLEDGTENTITATQNAVVTKGDLELDGKGTLLIEGAGITSGGNLYIQDGNLKVTGGSVSSITAERDLIVEEGSINCQGSLEAGRMFVIKGGTVLSAGGSTPDGSSRQKSITLSLGEPMSGNLAVVREEDEKVLFAAELPERKHEIFLSVPMLEKEKEISLYLDCKIDGEMDAVGIYDDIEAWEGKKLVHGTDEKDTFEIRKEVNRFSSVFSEDGKLKLKSFGLEVSYGYQPEKTALSMKADEDIQITKAELEVGDFLTVTTDKGKVFLLPKEGKETGEYEDFVTVWYRDEAGIEQEAYADVSLVVKQAENVWEEPLVMKDYTENGKQNKPSARAAFGDVVFTYKTGKGSYTSEMPTKAGKYSVKAEVMETVNYTGLVKEQDFEILAHTHLFDGGKVTTKPACTNAGVKTFTCTVCGYSYTEPVSATGHAYGSGKVTKEASCTAAGVRTFTCANDAAHSYTETIPALGSHSYDGGKVTKAATCNASGTRTFTCKRCGQSYGETIPATGHEYNRGVETKKATCKENGIITFTCSKCGDSYTKDTPSLGGHDYDSGKVTTAATCEKPGVKTFTCKNCSDSYTKEIPAAGHAYDAGVVTKKATCEGTGILTYTCKNCKKTYAEKTPATGHKWDGGKVTKEATCMEKGVRTFTCQNDSEHSYQEEMKKLAHDWDDGKITKEATCGEEGLKTFTCQAGKETREEYLPSTGEHTWSEGMESIQGELVYVCTTCGETRYEQPGIDFMDDTEGTDEDSQAAGEKVPDETQKSGGGFKAVLIVIYVIIALAAAGGIYYIYKRQKKGY